jgi:hypothetical protein
MWTDNNGQEYQDFDYTGFELHIDIPIKADIHRNPCKILELKKCNEKMEHFKLAEMIRIKKEIEYPDTKFHSYFAFRVVDTDEK